MGIHFANGRLVGDGVLDAAPHGLRPSGTAVPSGDPHGYLRRPDGIMLPRSLTLAWASRAESLRAARLDLRLEFVSPAAAVSKT
jgi:hypothetical protein